MAGELAQFSGEGRARMAAGNGSRMAMGTPPLIVIGHNRRGQEILTHIRDSARAVAPFQTGVRDRIPDSGAYG
jgi:hypothetical protein